MRRFGGERYMSECRNRGRRLCCSERRLLNAYNTSMNPLKHMAQRTVQSMLQGKVSVSVLAPSVKVSFGTAEDLVVVPDAPKELIANVLKKQ
eukprot:1170523-Prorocentrum_minimum.AAC.2